MSAEPAGHLICIIKSANNLRDCKKIGRMDPYVHVKSKNVEGREFNFKTPECKNGSKNPKWSDPNFEYDVMSLDHDIKFELLDHDKIGKDVLICIGKVKFSLFNGKDGAHEIPLEHDGKPAGTLHIETHYKPRFNHKELLAMSEAERLVVKNNIEGLNKGHQEFEQSEVKFHEQQKVAASEIAAENVKFEDYFAAEMERLEIEQANHKKQIKAKKAQ